MPMIPVSITGPDDSLDTEALIDSGADMSVLPLEMAEQLGLNLSRNINPCRGIGGETNSAEDSVRIRLTDGRETHAFEMPVKVLLDARWDIPPLLGRQGFFTEFAITFNERRNLITLHRSTHGSNDERRVRMQL